MKLLLVGFSEQNANLLSFLIQQHFKDIWCVHIDRGLTDDLKFILPAITDEHQDAKGLIINLGGVGMLSYQHQHSQMIREYVQSRPALLTTRTAIGVWQEVLGKDDNFLYLQSPYTKDTILPILKTLIDKAQSFITPIKNNHDKPDVVINIPAMTPQSFAPKADSETEKTANRQPLSDNDLLALPNNPLQNNLQTMLNEHFSAVYGLPMIKEFSKLFYQNAPFILKTSRYDVLIDPKNNLAVSTNIARVMDYFTVAKSHPEFVSSITIEILSVNESLSQVRKMEQAGARKYILSTLLWQIYEAILPDEISTMAHNLQLKLKFMPNFADIAGTPSYVQAVLASCLSTPKTIKNLYALFSEIKPETIHRIFLLANLAKIADENLIGTTALENDHIPNRIQQKNAGVNKAAKVGFFQRLLNKLTM